MADDPWRDLVAAFDAGGLEAERFHDLFFDLWHSHMAQSVPFPPAVERLFFVVEAYCSDPALRNPGSPFEADEAELRQAVSLALREMTDR